MEHNDILIEPRLHRPSSDRYYFHLSRQLIKQDKSHIGIGFYHFKASEGQNLKGPKFSKHRFQSLLQATELCVEVGVKMNADGSAAALAQAEEVTQGLGSLEQAKGIGLTGNR